MDLDSTIARAKELIAQREQIETELAALFGGQPAVRRAPPTCSKCGEIGHRSTSCPKEASD